MVQICYILQTQISYTLVRDNTVGGNALVYFYIDANGGLYLRKPLTAPDVPGQFNVRFYWKKKIILYVSEKANKNSYTRTF